jgi:hypothetical protein
MIRDVLIQLEHRHLLLAVEESLERVISIDLGPLLLVLKTILFDVDPYLGNNLRAGKRLGADNGRKFVIRGDRFEKCGVRFTFGGFLGCFSCHGLLLASRNLLATLFLPLKNRSRLKESKKQDVVEIFSQ